jgi:hypothetical protein
MRIVTINRDEANRIRKYAGQAYDRLNAEGGTFGEYLRSADRICKFNVGVSIFDLADFHWWDSFEDCVDVYDAVFELLQDEGYPVDTLQKL